MASYLKEGSRAERSSRSLNKNRPNVLIVKIGALGDVVRTTALLRALKANVYWITSRAALPLLPREALAGASDLKSRRALDGVKFETIFSLEENFAAARAAGEFSTREFIGVRAGSSGALGYTDSSAAWLDMGLISRLGRRRADALKAANRRSYQDILFAMAGLKFGGEDYWIASAPRRALDKVGPRRGFLVGLEARAGDRWPAKAWPGYSELAARLRGAGVGVRILRQRRFLSDYVSDIAGCDAIVSGDTLAMHLALALGKPASALFLCTSPWEIHDYGRLKKIVSPRLSKDFYRRGALPASAKTISVEEVFSSVLALAARGS